VPIDIQCPGCQRKLKVADKFAGKKAKCPNCQGVIEIPGAAAEPAASSAAKATKPEGKPENKPKGEAAAPRSASKSSETVRTAPKAKDEWYLQTEDGEQYGPVTKAELNEWVEEGRIDATCQLLSDGWDQWKWAEEVYPQIAPADAPADSGGLPGIKLDTAPMASPMASAAANPHATPHETKATETLAAASDSAGEGLTPAARRALADTRPWVLFFSILGFIGCAFALLASLVWMIASIGMVATMGPAGFVFLLMAMLTLGSAALYGFASYFLFTYAGNIQKYLRGNRSDDLEAAIVSQKLFWKLVGIVTAVVVGLYLALLLLALVLGFG
jgi:hypothetical protein